MGRLCFSTYVAYMKECDSLESNNKSGVDEKHTKDNIWSFLNFLHNNMIDSSSIVVLLGDNRNEVGTTGRDWCSYIWLIIMRARVLTSVRKMTFLSTSEAPPISLQWVLDGLVPLSIMISSSRGLEVVGTLNHLTLRGRTFLSSWLRSIPKLWLSRAGHMSC
jgi:hypothetical protein